MATCSEKSHGAGRSDGSEVRVVLEKILLQLGEDVLPVRVLPQGRDVRPEHRNSPDKTSERSIGYVVFCTAYFRRQQVI